MVWEEMKYDGKAFLLLIHVWMYNNLLLMQGAVLKMRQDFLKSCADYSMHEKTKKSKAF